VWQNARNTEARAAQLVVDIVDIGFHIQPWTNHLFDPANATAQRNAKTQLR